VRLADKQRKLRRSRESEKSLALKIQGKVQPASGALPVAKFKGDVVTDCFMIDDKTTQAESFNVSQKLMRKTRDDAFKQRRRGAVCVHFESTGMRYFVITEKEFLEYSQLLRMQNES
jgi:hypothetical protein